VWFLVVTKDGIDLGRRISHNRIQTWMHIFRVVLVEHLSVDNCGVFDLLGELRLEEQQLTGEDDL
jgi:hypothetical protein